MLCAKTFYKTYHIDFSEVLSYVDEVASLAHRATELVQPDKVWAEDEDSQKLRALLSELSEAKSQLKSITQILASATLLAPEEDWDDDEDWEDEEDEDWEEDEDEEDEEDWEEDEDEEDEEDWEDEEDEEDEEDWEEDEDEEDWDDEDDEDEDELGVENHPAFKGPITSLRHLRTLMSTTCDPILFAKHLKQSFDLSLISEEATPDTLALRDKLAELRSAPVHHQEELFVHVLALIEGSQEPLEFNDFKEVSFLWKETQGDYFDVGFPVNTIRGSDPKLIQFRAMLKKLLLAKSGFLSYLYILELEAQINTLVSG